MKNSREKIMLIALGGILAVWQGQALFRSFFVQPVADREASIAAKEASIKKKTEDSRRLELTKSKLQQWAARSLPPDPVKAQSLYQTWLIEEAQKAKFTDPKVEELGARGGLGSQEKTFFAITATIKAKATLNQVCDFLHNFHQAGFLHRVSGLSLEAGKVHVGNPELTVVMRVEALSLVGYPERTTLLVDAKNPPKPEKPLKDRKEYDPIVTNNLFVATFKPPVQPAPRDPRIPVNLPDTALYVKLTGAVKSADKVEAWLHDQTAGLKIELVPGSEFNVGGVTGKVISIGDSFMIVEVQGTKFRMNLGDNLKELRDLKDTDTTSRVPALPNRVAAAE